MLVRIVKLTFQENKVEDFLANFNKNKERIRNFRWVSFFRIIQG